MRRELFWARSLLPLLQRDLSAPWSKEVYATDASTWGRGVAVSTHELQSVREVGRVCDRWRFSREQEAATVAPEKHGAGSCLDILELETLAPNAPQSQYLRYHYLSWIVSGKRLAVGSGSARSPSQFLKGEQLSGPCSISLELRETTEHDMLS